MKGKIKESIKNQIGFVIVTGIYMVVHFLVSKDIFGSADSLGDWFLNLFAGVMFTCIELCAQAYTHYILLVISCAVPKRSVKIIIDIVGLLFNIAFSPIYYFASAFFSIESPGDDYLHHVYIYVSFVVVYIMKLIIDVVAYRKERYNALGNKIGNV